MGGLTTFFKIQNCKMLQPKSTIIPVHSHFQGKFNTCTGRTIDLNDPDPESLHIDDIARSLSRICRFGGHSSAFYSVAQHSVLIAALCKPAFGQWALMHDAAEAYLGDVIKPLKVLLEPHYRLIEERFEAAIIKRFDILYDTGIKKEIKRLDSLMLEYEHEALILGRPGRLLSTIEAIAPELLKYGWAWDSIISERIFKETFNKFF